VWAPAGFAKRLAAVVIGCPASSASNGGPAMSGPVLPMSTLSNSFGPTVDLGRRAERQCNRKQDQVQRYLTVHQILAKGA